MSRLPAGTDVGRPGAVLAREGAARCALRYSLLSLLTTLHSPLSNHYSQLTARYSLLATRGSRLTTSYYYTRTMSSSHPHPTPTPSPGPFHRPTLTLPLTPHQDHFIFSVESTGILPPEVLVQEAIMVRYLVITPNHPRARGHHGAAEQPKPKPKPKPNP